MGISHWPAEERPREKLLKKGAQALSDAELLAIFLRTGLPGVTAVDLSRKLLEAFGGIRGILDADFKQFSAQPGLGLAKYAHCRQCWKWQKDTWPSNWSKVLSFAARRLPGIFLKPQCGIISRRFLPVCIWTVSTG